MPSAHAIQPGTVIDRYRIERRLGSGSMGDVYLGMDIGLDRKAALKILSERHRDNRELWARFAREAKAVAAIAHPNVVQVFTTGTHDGRPYLAMEFLDGTDLGTEVEDRGPLSSIRAGRAVLDVARGLEAAAAAGLIHRDVKPANLVLLRDGSVKVTDFGLAKPMDPGDQPALTAMGVVVGTPDYIAPEQARGDAIDQRVDIYALGGTLYYLVTGMPPFRTGNPHQDKYLKVVARHLKNPPPDASRRNPIVDRQLSRLIRRMMAKDPAERPDYETLIGHLETVIERMVRDSGPSQPVPRRPLPGVASDRVSPTPVVARGAQDAGDTMVEMDERRPGDEDEDDDERPTRARMRSQDPSALGLDTDGRGQSRSGLEDAQAGVATRAAAPRRARSTIPGWLWGVTAVAALVFLVGLMLRLFGPLPQARTDAGAQAPGEERSPTAGSRAPEDGAEAAGSGVPAGMIAIEVPGQAGLYVDARPVTAAAYAAVFPNHEYQGAGDEPVRGALPGYAVSYADTVGKRLPTAEEWRAAAAHPSFTSEPGSWELLARPEGDASGAAGVPVISRSGSEVRPAGELGGVTFRLVRDRD